jgi:hypothetical protein
MNPCCPKVEHFSLAAQSFLIETADGVYPLNSSLTTEVQFNRALAISKLESFAGSAIVN